MGGGGRRTGRVACDQGLALIGVEQVDHRVAAILRDQLPVCACGRGAQRRQGAGVSSSKRGCPVGCGLPGGRTVPVVHREEHLLRVASHRVGDDTSVLVDLGDRAGKACSGRAGRVRRAGHRPARILLGASSIGLLGIVRCTTRVVMGLRLQASSHDSSGSRSCQEGRAQLLCSEHSSPVRCTTCAAPSPGSPCSWPW